jgi:hypothetical protein
VRGEERRRMGQKGAERRRVWEGVGGEERDGLALAGDDQVIDDVLRHVCKVAELRLPYHLSHTTITTQLRV